MDTKRKVRNVEVYIEEILMDFVYFLCKWGYCDSDVYAEEPTAVKRFLKEINK